MQRLVQVRFMVPMHARMSSGLSMNCRRPRQVLAPVFWRFGNGGGAKAPEDWRTPRRYRAIHGFRVPMHAKKRKEALHEPTRPSNRSLLWESGAEDARTPDASRPPGVSESREASGVRPIYRRFSSGAGRPAVHGANACGKRKGALASTGRTGAGTLLVRVCGGAGGQPPALPGRLPINILFLLTFFGTRICFLSPRRRRGDRGERHRHTSLSCKPRP